MAATRQDISEWFDRCKSEGAAYMIVVCDTFDYEDYPVSCANEKEAREKKAHCSGNMQRVMEIYDLNGDKETQMNQHRAMAL